MPEQQTDGVDGASILQEPSTRRSFLRTIALVAGAGTVGALRHEVSSDNKKNTAEDVAHPENSFLFVVHSAGELLKALEDINERNSKEPGFKYAIELGKGEYRFDTPIDINPPSIHDRNKERTRSHAGLVIPPGINLEMRSANPSSPVTMEFGPTEIGLYAEDVQELVLDNLQIRRNGEHNAPASDNETGGVRSIVHISNSKEKSGSYQIRNCLIENTVPTENNEPIKVAGLVGHNIDGISLSNTSLIGMAWDGIAMFHANTLELNHIVIDRSQRAYEVSSGVAMVNDDNEGGSVSVKNSLLTGYQKGFACFGDMSGIDLSLEDVTIKGTNPQVRDKTLWLIAPASNGRLFMRNVVMEGLRTDFITYGSPQSLVMQDCRLVIDNGTYRNVKTDAMTGLPDMPEGSYLVSNSEVEFINGATPPEQAVTDRMKITSRISPAESYN